MVVQMSTLSSLQHLSALQYPWHAKRARPAKMLRSSTPCSSSHTSVTRVTSPVDKESLRRQIVGFAVKRDTQDGQELKGSATTKSTNSTVKQNGDLKSLATDLVENGMPKPESSGIIKARTRPFIPANTQITHDITYQMPHVEAPVASKMPARRTKTAGIISDKKSAPKIVRFRMDEFKIGNTRAPIVTITDNGVTNRGGSSDNKVGFSPSCEVRGNAISVRREGLKGLLAYKDLCTENERRQNSLHTSMKLFKRRIRLNEERFIQPNESTQEDYVISSRSPFGDPQTSAPADDTPVQRPISSSDHVRLLRSALHSKHYGGNTVVKQSDNYDNGESSKNIKCSYRLPENLNWGKEVSFKDIKDDAIPNVKTYVLQEDGVPNAKFRKSNVETTVTLNTHNLNVHNEITQVNGQKIKVGDSEVAFDPRFLDWLEDSFTNVKLHKTLTFTSDDTFECPTPPVKRKMTAKT